MKKEQLEKKRRLERIAQSNELINNIIFKNFENSSKVSKENKKFLNSLNDELKQNLKKICFEFFDFKDEERYS
tara:strand:+ start:434 stop:652 length:219 start_codon:yes stop_codon:yes gene_type:complete